MKLKFILHGIDINFLKTRRYKYPWVLVRDKDIKSMNPDLIIFEPVKVDSDKYITCWRDYRLKRL